MPSFYDSYIAVFGIDPNPFVVVGLPDGATLIKVKMRPNRLAVAYVKQAGRFEARYLESAKGVPGAYSLGNVIGANIRPAAK